MVHFVGMHETNGEAEMDRRAVAIATYHCAVPAAVWAVWQPRTGPGCGIGIKRLMIRIPCERRQNSTTDGHVAGTHHGPGSRNKDWKTGLLDPLDDP